MKLDRPLASRLLGAVLAGVFASCQSSTEPATPESGPIVATVRFGVSADRIPDSADWSSPKQSGRGGLNCANGFCTDTLRLREALGSEGAQLRLWSLGIRIATLQLKQEGRSTTLAYTLARDTFELRVLDDFMELTRSRPDSFATLLPLRPSQLVTFYASALLAGKPGYSGFPAKIPTGMPTDSVKRALVATGAGLGLTAAKMESLGLGLDSAAIRVYAIELFAKGRLSAKDTGSLYPPPVLRVGQRLSVAGELVPGGEGVSVNGSFSWNKGRIVSNPRLAVRTAKGIDSEFTSSARYWPSPTDTGWTLTDNVKLYAPRGASPGFDTLVVSLSSDSGHSIEARVVFRVVPRDAVRPELRITRPGRDTSVPNEVYSLVVEATASDSSGIDSVRIRNKTLRDSPYLDSVFLALGENLVVAQAWDRFGNSTFDTVRITRAKPVGDTTPPRIVRISPMSDTSVTWSTKSIGLSWAVTDDSLLQRVTLDSIAVAGTTGLFSAQVPLRAGGNTFVLTAVDAKGNTRQDTVRIRRQADTVGPELELVSPGGDTSVSHPVARLRVAVAAMDAESGIDSVKIGSTRLLAAPFVDSVDLATGTNRISLQAWDKAGHRTELLLVVVRAASPGDTTAPVVVPVRPGGDTAVDWSLKNFELVCSVTDDSLLSKVWLNDSLWTGTAGTFQKTVGLAVGPNLFRIAAQDARGNRRLDTVRIVRSSDTVPPMLTITGPGKDSGVAHGVGRILVSAKASDAHGIDSIRIAGRTFSAESASDSVDLATGTNRIAVQAWDKAGNRSERVLSIVRAASPGDTTAPVITAVRPGKDTTVAWSVKSFELACSVTDDSLVSKVWLNDSVWNGTASTYLKTVALSVGPNLFRIAAQDARGNKRLDTVRILRAADTVAPVLVFTGPGKDTAVAYDVGKLLVSAKASDANGIDSIRIGSRTRATDAGSDSLALATGVNSILVQAWDKAGNRASATLRITRARDTVKPKIVRATGASEQVLSYPSSSSISWTVTDNDSLASVKIQGRAVSGSKSVYTANLQVVPGRFPIVIIAVDRAGNTLSDTVWWTTKLYDSRDRKSYNIGTMPDGKIWMTEDLALSFPMCESNCTDSLYTWSQAMDLPDSCNQVDCKLDTITNVRGICPADWHVPSIKEWMSLIDTAGIVHLKSASGWKYSIGGVQTTRNGDDLFGFRMLPRSVACSMAAGCTYSGQWWVPSKTSEVAESELLYVGDTASVSSSHNSIAKQLRCVRD